MSDEQVNSLELELLRQIGNTVEAMRREQGDDRKMLSDIDRRMIRFESVQYGEDIKRLEAGIEALKIQVGALKTAEDKRDGAIGFAEWASKHMPWLFAIALAVAGALGLDKLKG